MIDELINKQAGEEFDNKFCYDEYVGEINGVSQYKKTLRTNIDQTKEIKAHLRSSMKKVGEEIQQKFRKTMDYYADWGSEADPFYIEVSKLINSLTDKGENV